MASSVASIRAHLMNAPLALGPANVDTLSITCETLRALVDRPDLRITFVGAFSTGKTTLINALLGAPVLPSRANRATGVVVRVRSGSHPSAHFESRTLNGSVRDKEIPWDDRAHAILLDVRGGGAQAPTAADVAVEYPLPVWCARCTFVDTPGVLDTAELTARSLTELMQTDLLVLVLAADKLVSQDELAIARQAHELLGGNVVVVVNRIDLVEPAERPAVLEHAEVALAGLGNALVGRSRIFATAAQRALLAGQGHLNDPTSLTGMNMLTRWLGGLLEESSDELVLRARLGILAAQAKAAREGLVQLLAKADDVAEAVRRRDANRRRKRLTRLQQQVVDEYDRMHHFRAAQAKHGASFVNNYVRAVQEAMAVDMDWIPNIASCRYKAVSRYDYDVAWSVKAPNEAAGTNIPPFSVRDVLKAHLELAASPMHSAPAFKAIDTIAGSITRLLSVEFEPGRWLDKIASQIDGKQGFLNRIREDATAIVAAVGEASERYIDTRRVAVEREYAAAVADNVPSAELLTARERAHDATEALAWCDKLLLIVETGLKELKPLSWESEFAAQAGVIQDKVAGRIRQILKDKGQLTGIELNDIYAGETATWKAGDQYNSSWLRQMRRANPTVGAEFDAALDEMRAPRLDTPAYGSSFLYSIPVVCLGIASGAGMAAQGIEAVSALLGATGAVIVSGLLAAHRRSSTRRRAVDRFIESIRLDLARQITGLQLIAARMDQQPRASE